ncbi:hypothetical protein RHMOL_Rhmol07G0208400 [Rhododendron molle]|uniref:Uncharacterized protein n=2 Tax=Rhododendron molle TaxID=49168 RepID=A0ACC0N3M3_RHOML|nr:hypothetical protein RHMOL_Rhmol07G0208400 [Rhododendron molle]KAI8547606.1 hypothetical protein RHMOL_Rhmol07G0208400 [Rhododendron molle]
MMMKLREQGHRVLIYSQFQHMLDLLEDYCGYKKWQYERIDGKVGGAERQIRIDRFNAKNSSRFCFLLSTRAGGLGINLATADTVIIYDSDWNPHADLQAMARAHRLGQANKVMIYRLITRGTIEERMMELTKKKMVLEHLVVGKLKAQNINQEELDGIIRYGSKELFADENDEAGKSRQIHYDDAAIDRLLNREQVGDEEATIDDEEEDGFLKAFKVANFEYIDEVQAAAEEEEEAQKASTENKTAVNNSERASYWEELLRNRYEVHKTEEFNAMGKGKRSRKQMVSVEEEDLAGMEDLSSDDEDENYDAELRDDETAPTGAPAGRKPLKKKSCVDISEPLPLMEGEGRSLRVLGFNQNQRAAFVQILMRFGVGEWDWAEFTPRMKQKTYEEIKNYGRLFVAHIAEDVNDSPTFSDGVPKEGLRIEDVLVRIAVLNLIQDKVKISSENPGTPLFADEIVSRFPGLKSGRVWKEQHDLLLLRAVLRHGYGRWQAMLDDKELRVPEIICQELNLPIITLPVPGASQVQDGAYTAISGTPVNQTNGTANGNGLAADVAQGPVDTNRAITSQGLSMTYNFREIQRRQVEFIKKRVLLLEKAINTEYGNEVLGEQKTNETPSYEPETEAKVIDIPSPCSMEVDTQTMSTLPQIEVITAEEVSASACDDNLDRLKMAQLYNEICKVLKENTDESVEAYLANKPAGFQLRKNLLPLETIYEDINRILSPVQQHSSSSEHDTLNADIQTAIPVKLEGPGAPSTVQLVDDCKSGPEATTEGKVPILEPSSKKESNRAEQDLKKDGSSSPRDVPAADSSTRTSGDVQMEEKQRCEADCSRTPAEENTEKSDPAVVILGD